MSTWGLSYKIHQTHRYVMIDYRSLPFTRCRLLAWPDPAWYWVARRAGSYECETKRKAHEDRANAKDERPDGSRRRGWPARSERLRATSGQLLPRDGENGPRGASECERRARRRYQLLELAGPGRAGESARWSPAASSQHQAQQPGWTRNFSKNKN